MHSLQCLFVIILVADEVAQEHYVDFRRNFTCRVSGDNKRSNSHFSFEITFLDQLLDGSIGRHLADVILIGDFPFSRKFLPYLIVPCLYVLNDALFNQ